MELPFHSRVDVWISSSASLRLTLLQSSFHWVGGSEESLSPCVDLAHPAFSFCGCLKWGWVYLGSWRLLPGSLLTPPTRLSLGVEVGFIRKEVEAPTWPPPEIAQASLLSCWDCVKTVLFNKWPRVFGTLMSSCKNVIFGFFFQAFLMAITSLLPYDFFFPEPSFLAGTSPG